MQSSSTTDLVDAHVLCKVNVAEHFLLYVHIGAGDGFVQSCKKTITWANVDSDLCHYMVSLNDNGLNQLWWEF